MGPVLSLLVPLGIFVAVIVLAVRYAGKTQERLNRWFRDAADLTGGEYIGGSTSLLRRTSPKVVLAEHGTQIVADTYVVSSGKNSTSYSRIVARFALGWGPVLHIRRQHALRSLGKMLGMQDLEVGDAAFDDTFMVKGPSVGAILRVLDDDSRLSMVHQLPHWWVRSDGVAVQVERRGYPASPGELVTAIRLTTAIATADRRILETVAQHSDANLVGAAAILSGAGVEGRFTVGEHECVLAVAHSRGGPSFGFDCAAPDVASRLPEGTLAPALVSVIRDIGAARLTRDQSVARVSWWCAPEGEQVEIAWRVLVALTAPSTSVGAFR